MSHPVLIDGEWRAAAAVSTFRATNPKTKQPLDDEFPVSSYDDCDAALTAAQAAAMEMRTLPGDVIADFLEAFATGVEANKDAIVAAAALETALPVSPRLADGEFPRTTGQLRQAASAARAGSWRNAVIDKANNIRSALAPIGPVCVFGPNNFPLAFGSCSGGDFAAAIAAGNPVIAKANSCHPETTRLFALAADAAAKATNMPAGAVQLLYRLRHEDGNRLVADPRIGATGYTGSREAGLALKAAADAAGKPIYLELSSVNPVIVLPGALRERSADIVAEFVGSCLMGAGQFCTNPGLVLLIHGDDTDAFIQAIAEQFSQAPSGTLLSESVERNLTSNLNTLIETGAEALTTATPGGGEGFSHSNVLLRTTASAFLSNPAAMQTEAFGNASLMVVADDISEAVNVIQALEGNLTGCIYSHTGEEDEKDYARAAAVLATKVGRVLNDKMPTGVAVSPAMNHGGPFPATGHPGFTAVGIPAAITRFAALQCYDNVRPNRLPAYLQDANPNGKMWRCVDGEWTQE